MLAKSLKDVPILVLGLIFIEITRGPLSPNGPIFWIFWLKNYHICGKKINFSQISIQICNKTHFVRNFVTKRPSFWCKISIPTRRPLFFVIFCLTEGPSLWKLEPHASVLYSNAPPTICVGGWILYTDHRKFWDPLFKQFLETHHFKPPFSPKKYIEG